MQVNDQKTTNSIGNELARQAWYAKLAFGDWQKEQKIPSLPAQRRSNFLVLP